MIWHCDSRLWILRLRWKLSLFFFFFFFGYFSGCYCFPFFLFFFFFFKVLNNLVLYVRSEFELRSLELLFRYQYGMQRRFESIAITRSYTESRK